MSSSTLLKPSRLPETLHVEKSPRGPVQREDKKPSRLVRFFEKRASQTAFQFQQGMKRLTDLILATGGLLVLSPILLSIALLIKVTSPGGPILYKSLRIGKNYKPFYMYKFRTMVADADKKREALRQEANLEGQLFKLKNDPRITPFGAMLRAYSLDEFPQLLNVIKGDMSLVGPRPLPPDESELFQDPYTLRFEVLPGVTGKWQVSGRSSLSFSQLCELELDYVIEWNLVEDFKILFKTGPAVALKSGAY